jgi:hypothetical protein
MYRHGIAAALLIAFSLSAQAQQQYQQQPSAQEQQPRTFPERFAMANITNDGCLTLRQARHGLPGVAKQFHEIDADGRGCVTLDEIRTYRQSLNAERRQQQPPRQQQPEQQPRQPAQDAPPAGY